MAVSHLKRIEKWHRALSSFDTSKPASIGLGLYARSGIHYPDGSFLDSLLRKDGLSTRFLDQGSNPAELIPCTHPISEKVPGKGVLSLTALEKIVRAGSGLTSQEKESLLRHINEKRRETRTILNTHMDVLAAKALLAHLLSLR